jgi:hypothetical protein
MIKNETEIINCSAQFKLRPEIPGLVTGLTNFKNSW